MQNCVIYQTKCLHWEKNTPMPNWSRKC
ncbi:hypothetical protein Gohar_019938 [Gossypium harknessii]|uniref:Uncharacterized protein n=1 Tax=Gossypium harknessii TaxID=34285 RepID=A0A7J9HW54_9ROSI|nr:hypothetical protein [Gossypium harknessii]